VGLAIGRFLSGKVPAKTSKEGSGGNRGSPGVRTSWVGRKGRSNKARLGVPRQKKKKNKIKVSGEGP